MISNKVKNPKTIEDAQKNINEIRNKAISKLAISKVKTTTIKKLTASNTYGAAEAKMINEIRDFLLDVHKALTEKNG